MDCVDPDYDEPISRYTDCWILEKNYKKEK